MDKKSTQIPLVFEPRVCYKRDDFMVNRCNLQAINVIDSWPNWPFFAYVLYGPKGCGKSHLAHVFAEHVACFYQKPVSVKIINAIDITSHRRTSLTNLLRFSSGNLVYVRKQTMKIFSTYLICIKMKAVLFCLRQSKLLHVCALNYLICSQD